ncbi:hypothetical protein C1C97_006775 [Kocuria tytonis]|uniref:Uncharacterized protein n=1 Tax=Kocuria tytonis TaxID=2054280 RepID=A0A495A5K8_9MICC|nr:hypothetical protein C1C97_006775 [Kocuria tytonis]
MVHLEPSRRGAHTSTRVLDGGKRGAGGGGARGLLHRLRRCRGHRALGIRAPGFRGLGARGGGRGGGRARGGGRRRLGGLRGSACLCAAHEQRRGQDGGGQGLGPRGVHLNHLSVAEISVIANASILRQVICYCNRL